MNQNVPGPPPHNATRLEQPPSTPSPALMRGADQLVAIIESEKKKVRESLLQDIRTREREYDQFRAKAAEALTAALTRVNLTQVEAQAKIQQVRVDADKSIREQSALAAAREQDVEVWKSRYAEQQDELQRLRDRCSASEMEVELKSAEIDSLRQRISLLESESQNAKAFAMQGQTEDIFMGDGPSNATRDSADRHDGSIDFGYTDVGPGRAESTLYDGTLDDPFGDQDLASFALSPEKIDPVLPAETVPDAAVLASPRPSTPPSVLSDAASAATACMSVQPASSRVPKGFLIIPSPIKKVKRRSIKRKASPMDDEERANSFYVRDRREDVVNNF